VWLAIIAIVISYLLGSVSFSILLAKSLRKIDIRQYGSGNAGATNTLRVLGKGPALAVFVLDIAKGIAAVALGLALKDGDYGWLPVACGLAAIVGHNWPVFFKFKGGKGIATTIGAMVMLAAIPSVIAGVVAIAAIALTRYGDRMGRCRRGGAGVASPPEKHRQAVKRHGKQTRRQKGGIPWRLKPSLSWWPAVGGRRWRAFWPTTAIR
jgi:acyl-phosphate glycerol 3-phosphate acyltransferase